MTEGDYNDVFKTEEFLELKQLQGIICIIYPRKKILLPLNIYKMLIKFMFSLIL